MSYEGILCKDRLIALSAKGDCIEKAKLLEASFSLSRQKALDKQKLTREKTTHKGRKLHLFEQYEHSVYYGNFDKIIAYVRQGISIDTPTKAGITPLMQAASENIHEPNHKWCINGCEEQVLAVSFLIDRLTDKPTINIETKIGHTSLTYGCFKGRFASVKALITRGACIDQIVKGGKTALIIAAMNGKSDIVRLLLQYGARDDIRDDNGKSALNLAEDSGFSSVIEIIQKHKRGFTIQDVDAVHVNKGQLFGLTTYD